MKKATILLMCMLLISCACAAMAEAEKGAITMPEMKEITPYAIPENEAMEFVKNMGVGWNLGNTFDAHASGFVADEMAIESLWCGVRTTPEMIEAVHEAGFDTLRLPVSWHNHVSGDDFTISGQWLDRVQEVVDIAISHGMYVILNTHHDVDKTYYYPDQENHERSKAYVRSVWQQLAARFAEYDEHLIFESLNEPRLKDTALEWTFQNGNPKSREAAGMINVLNQLFVDTVRAAGGKNAQRYLMVPGYAASVDGATNPYFALPKDTADNRIIVSVHAYTPYSFALEDGGTDCFSVANMGQSMEIVSFMDRLYRSYTEQGIPVVIGEFGARDKKGNLQDRVDFTAFYVATARARNISCVWWDNGAHAGSGELFGILDRKTCEWTQPDIVQALVRFGGTKK